MSQVQGSLLCLCQKFGILLTAPPRTRFLGLLLHFVLESTHITSAQFIDYNWLTGKGVGRSWVNITVAITALLALYFTILWFCWGWYLAYILMLSTVSTTWMWSPQKLSLVPWRTSRPPWKCRLCNFYFWGDLSSFSRQNLSLLPCALVALFSCRWVCISHSQICCYSISSCW